MKQMNMATGGGGGVPERPPRKQQAPTYPTKKPAKK